MNSALTVETVLKLEEFQRATLVAGKTGLNREVRWAHIVDLPDMADWSRPGELLFTTALGLSVEKEAQKTLIPDLEKIGVAGIVVSVGRYFHTVPEHMIAQANEIGFPIITLPWDIPFYDVTRVIMERVINDRYAILQESLVVHNRLMEIVLKGTGLDDLAETLADLVQCSVSIEDASFHLLAYANKGEIDEARRETILLRQTPPMHREEIDKLGILDTLHRTGRPVHIPPIPHIGLRYERVVAPIVAAGELLGYVWLIPHQSLSDEFGIVAVERAATVAAIILMRERAVYEVQQRLKGDFFERLLNARIGEEGNLREEARKLGLVLNGQQQIMIVRNSAEEMSPLLLQRTLQQALTDLSRSGMVLEWGKDLILLATVQDTHEGIALAHKLWQALSKKGYRTCMSLGNAYSDIRMLLKSYQEAEETLMLAFNMPHGVHVLAFDDLGTLHWLQHLPPEALGENKYYRAVEKLAEYDSQHKTGILDTLMTYLDSGANALQAARRLYIHRNTLRQRLDRASELMGIDLHSPRDLFEIHIAIKAFALYASKERKRCTSQDDSTPALAQK